MYIKNRLASIIYKADILVLAIFGIVTQVREHGWWAFRSLAVVAGAMCTGYYLVVLILGFKDKERPLSQALCPALKGTITVGLALSGIMATAFGAELDLVDGMAILGLILPLLMLLDWLLFDEKGRIKLTAPFYFLTLPIIYFSVIIISSQHVSANIALRYPYSFLNFRDGKIGSMLVAIGINLIIVFTFGYAYTLADKLLCGEERVKEKAMEEPKEKEIEAEVKQLETSAITEPERILPAGAEVALPAAASETEEDSEASSDSDEEENDWDSDSYVIGEPTPTEASVGAVAFENKEDQRTLDSAEVKRKPEKTIDIPKSQASQPKSPSKPHAQAKSKQMDIIMPKNDKNNNNSNSNKDKANKTAKNNKNRPVRRIETRTNAPNRNGRTRRNNHRTPKFEDIMRVESQQDKNNASSAKNTKKH